MPRMELPDACGPPGAGLGEVLDEEDAVEVVELVLEQPPAVVGLEVDLVAVEVVALHVDLLRSHDLEAEPGNRQAALDEGPLAPALGDGRG